MGPVRAVRALALEAAVKYRPPDRGGALAVGRRRRALAVA